MTERKHKSIFFAAVLIFSITCHVLNFSQSYEIIKPVFAESEKLRVDSLSKFGTGNADEKNEQDASTSHSVESEDKIDVSETLAEIRQLLKELEEIIQSILG